MQRGKVARRPERDDRGWQVTRAKLASGYTRHNYCSAEQQAWKNERRCGRDLSGRADMGGEEQMNHRWVCLDEEPEETEDPNTGP